jgi:hypothetical protein
MARFFPWTVVLWLPEKTDGIGDDPALVELADRHRCAGTHPDLVSRRGRGREAARMMLRKLRQPDDIYPAKILSHACLEGGSIRRIGKQERL